jgi:hypothetical protein
MLWCIVRLSLRYGQKFALRCSLYNLYTKNRWHSEQHTHNGYLIGEDQPLVAFVTTLNLYIPDKVSEGGSNIKVAGRDRWCGCDRPIVCGVLFVPHTVATGAIATILMMSDSCCIPQFHRTSDVIIVFKGHHHCGCQTTLMPDTLRGTNAISQYIPTSSAK